MTASGAPLRLQLAALVMMALAHRSATQPGCNPRWRTCFRLACPPGNGRQAPHLSCSPCPPGTYNPGGVYGPCLWCPRGTVTVGVGATRCGCKPGTGTIVDASYPCYPCENGTYSPGGSLSPCQRCPGSGFMVTPRSATRASQCTCKPGYGSTRAFPESCQLCPIGSFANAQAAADAVPGVPAQSSGTIRRGITGASFQPCIPCCSGGIGTCSLTTTWPGATSYADCVVGSPPAQPPLNSPALTSPSPSPALATG